MDPIKGGKSEFVWLFALMLIIPVMSCCRKSNESELRKQIKTNNCYAKMQVDNKYSEIRAWNAKY